MLLGRPGPPGRAWGSAAVGGDRLALPLLPSLMHSGMGEEDQNRPTDITSALSQDKLLGFTARKHETEAIVLSCETQQKNSVEASLLSLTRAASLHLGSADGRSLGPGPGERAGACRERKGNGAEGKASGRSGHWGQGRASITEITWNPSFQDAFGS